jgi:putative peptidoglycan lipid II flippase
LIMNLISVALSILAAIYIQPKWVVVAMAIIFTFHYFIGTGISFYLISKHKINLPLPAITLHYLRLLSIFALSIAPLFLLRNQLPGGNLIQLLIVLVISSAIYLALGFIFKIKEIKSAIRILTSAIK